MCFFQAALLGGYCYAHALNRWLPVRVRFYDREGQPAAVVPAEVPSDFR